MCGVTWCGGVCGAMVRGWCGVVCVDFVFRKELQPVVALGGSNRIFGSQGSASSIPLPRSVILVFPPSFQLWHLRTPSGTQMQIHKQVLGVGLSCLNKTLPMGL